VSVQAPKLQKTAADFVVIGISPLLIMALVGSLVFFLTEVVFRGGAPLAIRWVLFWFVIAIVLVSRMGIELGPIHATGYGIALAAATWLYLAWTHGEYHLALLLLAITWWCARQLTRDCTLIDDEDDSTGEGALDLVAGRDFTTGESESLSLPTRQHKTPRPPDDGRPAKTRRRRPGVWVVYFSIAALPLFGMGQVVLPSENVASRRAGFVYLTVYLAAALGLLLTTHFLGLRRYLRQRQLRMPAGIVRQWFVTGALVGLAVFTVSSIWPRPGAEFRWQTVASHVDKQLRRVSEYATRSANGSPETETETEATVGQHGEVPERSFVTPRSVATPEDKTPTRSGEQEDHREADDSGRHAAGEATSPTGGRVSSNGLHITLRILVILAGVGAVLWWLVRNRRSLIDFVRSLANSLSQWWKTLTSWQWARRPDRPKPMRRVQPSFEDPFSGSDRGWEPERLVTYTHDMLEMWAAAHGFGSRPSQTSAEFCRDISVRFPEMETDLAELTYLYGHAAYGHKLPSDYRADPLRRIWQHMRSYDCNLTE
jgi:hypothetical protein